MRPEVQAAVQVLLDNPRLRVTEVAREFGVPRTTLRAARDRHTVRELRKKDFCEAVRHLKIKTGIGLPKPPVHNESIAGRNHLLIGDTQVKPGIPLDYLSRIGQYAAHKKPDVIVQIGDFTDMASLSFHSQPGSKTYNAQNYRDDIVATHLGMRALMEPIQAEMKHSGWNPRLVLTLGNHEDRINRTLEAIPKLDGTIGLPDLEYERWGWEVVPYLQPIVIDGIAYCHFFCSGQLGRSVTSARAALNKMHMSCVMGHQQGRDMAMGKRGDGKPITAIICGSSYEHEEEYLNPQTNTHWRGIYNFYDVRDGEFEENAVSMAYLRRKYGG